jgi:very-short-patch-repair endonuclease
VLLNATKDLPITVLSKVRLNDLLEATGDNKQTTNNRINRLHVDFVLLSQPDFQPLVVIELDGASHGSQLQQARDAKKDAALKAAGLALVRFPNGVQPAQFAPLLEPYLKIGMTQVSTEAEAIRAAVSKRAQPS